MGNSSSRIQKITHISGAYNFLYNGGQLSSIGPDTGGTTWQFTYQTTTANTPWTPTQNPANMVPSLKTVTNIPSGSVHTFDYYNTGELNQVTLPYGGRLRWTYGEWTSVSQRIVREINQRYLKKDTTAAETGHILDYDTAGDAGREYHSYRRVSESGQTYDKVWWFNAQRRLQQLDERKAGAVTLVRKTFSWSVTPGSQQPFIWQVDTTLEPANAGAKTRRSTQALDTYGNVTTSEEWDFGPLGNPPLNTRRITTTAYVTNTNYLSRYIRNRMASVSTSVGSGAATLQATYAYDAAIPPFACQSQAPSPPTGGIQGPVLLHDSVNYGPGFIHRGNPKYVEGTGGIQCFYHNEYGVLWGTVDNSGATTLTPDGTKQFAVPSAITANSYTTNLQWDSVLNLTGATGPNSDAATFGWDVLGRPTTQTGPDGEAQSYTFSVAGRLSGRAGEHHDVGQAFHGDLPGRPGAHDSGGERL